ncbi:MAG TPA: hypothetical protein VMH31_06050 [Methylomirabilota bacterium]|nr:hypothetical protein [Methylomirabilota bacterium]
MVRTILVATIVLLIALVVPISVVGQNADNIPGFRPGQTCLYSVRLHEITKVKPESATSLARSAVIDSEALVRVEVLSVDGRDVKVRTSFEALSSDTHVRLPATDGVQAQDQRRGIDDRITVQATIGPGGVISEVAGLNGLYPEQQQVWRSWASAFGLAVDAQVSAGGNGPVALAEAPVSLGDLNGLMWSRELQSTGQEPCSGYALGAADEPEKSTPLARGCTGLVVREKLTQTSPQLSSAQQSYQQRDLKKSGSARGKGVTRAQVSRDTGRLVRSDSESEQHAEVYFMRTDRSESMEYKTNTKTRVEIRLLTETLLQETNGVPKP